MSLGRDELAHAYHMRLLETYPHNPEVAVRRAIQHADALLEALSSKPALAPPPAASPVAGRMGVGDVVRVGEYEIVLVDFTENVAIRKAWILTQPSWSNLPIPRFDSWGACWPSPVVRLRLATPAERAAAGLSVAAPVEAPDARGEWRDNWPAAITEQLRIDGHAPSYNAAFVRLVAERVIAARGAS